MLAYGKVLIGPSVSCDNVITQFGHYESWLQKLIHFGDWRLHYTLLQLTKGACLI